MTEELKKAIELAKTDEEKKAVAEKFRDELMSLSEEDLNNIAGGSIFGKPLTWTCPRCNCENPISLIFAFDPECFNCGYKYKDMYKK